MEDRKDNNPELEDEGTDLETNEPGEETPAGETADADGTAEVDEDEVERLVEGTDTAEISEEIEEARERETAAPSKTVTASAGSSSLYKLLGLLGVILLVGALLVLWKTSVAGHDGPNFSKVSQEEMQALLRDFNPMQLKQLSENPQQKEQLVNNLKELLAIASQAKKDGFDQRPEIKDELESIETSLWARSYDQKINADKGPMPPFGFISEEQVNQFWGSNGQDQGGIGWIWNGAENRRREAEFRKFIDTKIELAKKSGQIPQDMEPSEEELKQARDAYAKTRIYYNEAMQKLDNLSSLPESERSEWQEWKEKTELQIKLQKAQYLTQNYFQEVVSKKLEVTDEEVQEYIKKNPEMGDSEEKRKKAEDLLRQVKAGGDFAELAKEHSEDPGSKSTGGLYEGVGKGQFAPEFEKAALALEPGQVADQLVKTNFGYHIIKLERKGETKGADGNPQPTYDARHILISTMVKDPDNPMAREMPVEQFVRAKLEKEKQQKVLDEIKENNPVEVAEFEVPKVSDEEIQKLQEEQMKRMQELQQQMQQQQPQSPEGGEKEAAPQKEEAPTEEKK